MSRFVLVHGAWHGGWCWERVAPLLAARGHRVETPTLRGLGERASELDRSIGLRTHVEELVAILREDPEPAVLVGHSYGGLVAREAADRAPERVGTLVLVEGWLGSDGASMLTLAPARMAAAFRDAAEQHGDGWRIPAPDPSLLVSAEADATWLRARLTDQPLRTFIEPTRLTGAVAEVPTLAVVSPAPLLPFGEWAAAIGAPVVAIDGAHDLMLTSPTELARELRAAAASAELASRS